MRLFKLARNRLSKDRRGEQLGATHKSFPLRWLGVLLTCSVGAAWALSPVSELEPMARAQTWEHGLIVEGESQAVSLILGSLLGPQVLPVSEERLLSTLSESGRRVVLSGPKCSELRLSFQEATREAAFLRAVEELEEEYSLRGVYPQIPTCDDKTLTDVEYRNQSEGVTFSSESLVYHSAEGFKAERSEETPLRFKWRGAIETVRSGWGPWSKDVQVWKPKASEGDDGLSWLERLPSPPEQSARLFFPVSRELTGYFFRPASGDSPYTHGEFLFDRESCSFSLKLHRREVSGSVPSSSLALEPLLENSDAPCLLAGDAAFLGDLGFRVEGRGEVVLLRSQSPLATVAADALTGARLNAMAQTAVPVERETLAEGEGDALAVGRVSLVDQLGQVHAVVVRGGRGSSYDWVLGQFVPSSEGGAWSHYSEGSAYVPENKTRASVSIVAGE